MLLISSQIDLKNAEIMSQRKESMKTKFKGRFIQTQRVFFHSVVSFAYKIYLEQDIIFLAQLKEKEKVSW
jgi:hypothetical protein